MENRPPANKGPVFRCLNTGEEQGEDRTVRFVAAAGDHHVFPLLFPLSQELLTPSPSSIPAMHSCSFLTSASSFTVVVCSRRHRYPYFPLENNNILIKRLTPPGQIDNFKK
jgi:hypothetical protein